MHGSILWLRSALSLHRLKRWKYTAATTEEGSIDDSKGRVSISERCTLTLLVFLRITWAQPLLVQSCGGFMDDDYLCTFECRHEDEGGAGTWTCLNRSVESSPTTHLKPWGKKMLYIKKALCWGDWLPVSFPIRNIKTNIIYEKIALCQWLPNLFGMWSFKLSDVHLQPLTTGCKLYFKSRVSSSTKHWFSLLTIWSCFSSCHPSSPSRMLVSSSMFKWGLCTKPLAFLTVNQHINSPSPWVKWAITLGYNLSLWVIANQLKFILMGI